jgi:hypothetical protein
VTQSNISQEADSEETASEGITCMQKESEEKSKTVVYVIYLEAPALAVGNNHTSTRTNYQLRPMPSTRDDRPSSDQFLNQRCRDTRHCR